MASQIAAVVVLALAFLAAGIDSYAATLVVTKTADTADGICDSDCSLREAVAAAASGDTVVFSPHFSSPQTITLTGGQIQIAAKLAIDGPGAGLLTVSGNNAGRIFRISGGVDVTFVGMTLRDGRVTSQDPPGGGAILVLQSSLTLDSMVLSNNTAPVDVFGLGGGVYVDRGALTVQNSSISNNAGGAMYTFGSTVNVSASTISYNQKQGVHGLGDVSNSSSITVVDSTVNHNTDTGIGNSGSHGPTQVLRCTVRYNGGGIGANATLTIDNSVISHNVPQGGVGFSGVTAVISNTVIDSNFANTIGGDGGGLDNEIGTMYVFNSSITNNRAFEYGGGISSYSGRLYLTNSTVSGNRADNGGGNCNCPGGGIFHGGAFGGYLELTNSTIANNNSAGSGGGIYHDSSGSSSIILKNTIIAGNIATASHKDVSGIVVSQGYNLVGNTTGSQGWLTTDLLNLNAALGPLGINGGPTRTHALMPGSPAINAGNTDLARDPWNNSLLLHDQRGTGFERVVSGNVDIGAYEANYSLFPVTLAGRVSTGGSRGISKAVVTLTDSTGGVRYTLTNPFGNYRFLNVPPGITYTIRITHKTYIFDSPQFITVDRDRDDLNFTAQ